MIDILFLVAGLAIAGYILLSLEVFVVPGFSVPGIAGLVCIGAACVIALRNFGPLAGGAFTGGVIVLTGTLAYLLPKTPLGRWVVHRKTLQTAQTRVEDLSVGNHGITESVLRPAGIARFDERRESVVTRGEFIEAEQPIVIVELEGLRIVVEALTTESTATTSD